MHLREAVQQVMTDSGILAQYPEGMMGHEVLEEIRLKFGPDAFPLCSTLDVIDELRELYGR